MIENITLEEYQEAAVNAICNDAMHYLDSSRRHELTLKSPTGSGKTVMATSIMERIAEEHGNVAFLWTSVGKGELHLQSGKSIQEKTSKLTTKQIEHSFLGAPMNHSDVYVINWEKLNGKNNILVSEGEDYNFFDLLKRTRDEGTSIVLIIDESHLGAGKASNTAKIKNKIKADLLINLSATPADGQIVSHEVTFDDVINAGIIKRNIHLNDAINHDDPKGEVNAILTAAKKKRDKLKNLYPNNINPLMIVALPNGTEKRLEVEYVLKTMGITYENGKLACWFSGTDKENREGVEEKDCPVEILLFKTAVATGWDCTRAHILVKLRSTKSERFSRQLTGRILRMPERKHYEHEDLNTAYIYTDETNIIFEDNAFPSSKIKSKKTLLKKGVSLELSMKRLKRIEKSQLYRDTFAPILWKVLDEENLNYDYTDIQTSLLKSQTLELTDTAVDTTGKEHVLAGAVSVGEKVLNNIKEISKENGITSTTSFKTITLLIIKYINENRGWTTVDGKIQGLVIMTNMKTIAACLEKALIDYHVKINQDIADRVYNELTWTPPAEIWTDDDARPTGRWNKYAYGKFYFNMNEMEYDYAESIDEDVNVAWWLKNGDKGIDHFSIPYGDGKNFFPDFIIKYHNGDVKISETKGKPFHVEAKREALIKYGEEHDILTEYLLE